MTSTPAGLHHDEAARRLAEHGPNELPATRPRPLWRRFLAQLASPLVMLLLAAVAFETGLWLYEGRREWPLEAIAIAATVALNAGLGVAQEWRSERALSRLRDLAAPTARVLRGGVLSQRPAREIVPGDMVLVEAGDRVPADGTVHDTSGILVDESMLTGESYPVELRAMERVSSGTIVVRGRAFVHVDRTGPRSAMGKLAALLGAIELGDTPLERRLDVLGKQVVRVVLLTALAIVLVGFALEGERGVTHVVLFAVALAVAAVPEELPAVLTLTLALGVERMARRKALVRRLSAVEALGSVTVICTDKTGTLTENKLEVRELVASDEREARRAMAWASDPEAVDPLDAALLGAARDAGPRPKLVSSRPFDSEWRYARVTVEADGDVVTYAKGAPEVVLSRCRERAGWSERVERLAADGLRVLALARAHGEREDGWDMLGLVALWDPPRPEVPDAVRRAQEAGVRVVMVTGDHPATARAVARAVGIRDEDVHARVRPEDKLALVQRLQAQGDVVAMTGDGINDAPALRKADVGVAMGKRGSDVSREAADLVLLDDDFATIVVAIEEGRSLYENIQKFLRFMFSTSLAFFLLVTGGALGSWILGLRTPAGELLLPLTALQILWINFLADGPPSFAIGVDRNPGLMERRPRDPKSPLMDRPSLRFIVASAVVKAGAGLALLVALPWLGWSLAATQAAVFGYEFLAQLAFAYPSRRISVRATRNLALHLTILGGAALLSLLLAVPWLRAVLALAPLDAMLVGIVLATVALTWAAAEATLPWARRAPAGPSRPRRPGLLPARKGS